MDESSRMVSRGGRPAAVVTGASRGLGKATALLLAARGYNLALNGLDSEELDEVAHLARDAGAEVCLAAGDVTDYRVVRSLVHSAGDTFGRIDALVNNAGSGLTKPFVTVSDEEWEKHFALHMGAVVVACREAASLLVENKGAIVNMASIAAIRSLPGRVAYASAKGSVMSFTRALACEWGGDGVRVNAVAPGTVVTPLVESNLATSKLDREKLLERTPLGRLGLPEEVARPIAFLLSSDASYITGQTVFIDGGWSIWGGW